MPPEQQVCSLKLAQKLEALGEKQESLFYWARYFTSSKGINIVPVYRNQLLLDGVDLDKCTSAFSVAELGERLPKFVKMYGDYPLTIKKNYSDDKWSCGYRKDAAMFFEDKLADAMAKMLIYLIEQGLVTLEK